MVPRIADQLAVMVSVGEIQPVARLGNMYILRVYPIWGKRANVIGCYPAFSASFNRCTFPDGPFGNSATKRNHFGVL